MSKTSLLINEPPLQLLPSLAKLIGLNEAIVTQQLHFYLLNPKSGVERNGERWIYNTYQQWQEECFCFWSLDTIKRVFLRLEEMNIVVSCQPDGRESRRKYYRLNKGMIQKLTFETLAEQGNLPSSESRTGQVALIEGGKLPSWEQGKLPPSLIDSESHRESSENTPKAPSAPASPSLRQGKGVPSIKSKRPTTPAAITIAKLYGRKLTTEWSDKEIKAFRKLQPIDLDELALVETYYGFERLKGDDGIHRRDLQTFLNNFRGEVDRAMAWRDNRSRKPVNGTQAAPAERDYSIKKL